MISGLRVRLVPCIGVRGELVSLTRGPVQLPVVGVGMPHNSLARCGRLQQLPEETMIRSFGVLRLLVKVDKSHGNPAFPWVGAPWSVLPKSPVWFEPVTTAICSAPVHIT